MNNPVKPYSFGNFSDGFVTDLAERLRGRKVLEIFAGNGLLASKLSSYGIDITSTSLFAGHDGHQLKMYFDVIEMHAVEAVRQYGDTADVLLMCWPTTTEAAAQAIIEWGSIKDIIFIGEMTDYSKNHLGGCATDFFFEITDVNDAILSYETHNFMEHAVILRCKPEYARPTVYMPPDYATKNNTSTN